MVSKKKKIRKKIKNENIHNYQPLSNKNIIFGVNDSLENKNDIKEEKIQDNLPLVDKIIKVGIKEEENKKEDKESKNQNITITQNEKQINKPNNIKIEREKDNHEKSEKEDEDKKLDGKESNGVEIEKKGDEKIKSLFDDNETI